MRKFRRPLFFAALSTLVIVAAVAAFFVPTAFALCLVAVATVVLGGGSVALARRF
jgi:hypothetical protein